MVDVLRVLDQNFCSFSLCLVGMIFIISGVRTIRKQKTVLVGKGSHFQWKNPIVIKGEKATREGRGQIFFGFFLFMLGICPIVAAIV